MKIVEKIGVIILILLLVSVSTPKVWALDTDDENTPNKKQTSIHNNQMKQLADSVDSNDFITNYRVDGTLAIISYSGDETDVVIPEKIDDIPITAIGEQAFENKGLTSVTIPNTVKEIKSSAFRGNTNLTSVTFGSGLEKIEDYAFYSTNISHLIFPASLTSIGESAFSINKNLSSITFLGDNLTEIGDYAFYSNNIENIIFPSSLISIGDNAFSYNNLTLITFNDKLKTIGKEAFKGNTNLTSVTFGEDLETIGDDAFESCLILSTVNFGKKLESIGFGAFSNNSIEQLVIPESLKSIGKYAFTDNPLTIVKFEGNLDYIGEHAIGPLLISIPSLKNIIFKGDVTNIANGNDISRYDLHGHPPINIYGKSNTNVKTFATTFPGYNFIDINQVFNVAFSKNGSEGIWEKNTSTKVEVTSEKFPNSDLYYAWSDSTNVPTDSQWKPFISGDTIPTEKDGVQYLHIFIDDELGLDMTYHSEAFKIDTVSPTINFETNGNNDWTLSGSTKVTVSDTASDVKANSLQYTWTTSSVFPKDAQWTSFTNGEAIQKQDVNGTWYLHIQAEDEAGNKVQATSKAFHLLKSKEVSVKVGNEAISVYPTMVIDINGTNVSVQLPEDLPEGTTLRIDLLIRM